MRLDHWPYYMSAQECRGRFTYSPLPRGRMVDRLCCVISLRASRFQTYQFALPPSSAFLVTSSRDAGPQFRYPIHQRRLDENVEDLSGPFQQSNCTSSLVPGRCKIVQETCEKGFDTTPRSFQVFLSSCPDKPSKISPRPLRIRTKIPPKMACSATASECIIQNPCSRICALLLLLIELSCGDPCTYSWGVFHHLNADRHGR